MSQSRFPAALALVALALSACGDDAGAAPAIDTPTVACDAPPGGSYADSDVVSEVSVRVNDADRDLVSVRASINGVQLGEITDDDGDLYFNWTPPAGFDPIICRGTLNVRVIATDIEGNTSDTSSPVDLNAV